MQAFPQFGSGSLAGHSLGGAIAAARFVRNTRTRATGLVLWAAIPADDDDLSRLTIPAHHRSTATDDRLVQPETIAALVVP